MSALFQPEISTIEFQIAQLQSQLASLNKAEFVADGILQAVASGIEELSTIRADAITRLKLAVLNLFQGDDNPNDGNGNNSNPEPQPTDDGGYELLSQPNQDNFTAELSVIRAESVVDAIAVTLPESQEIGEVKATITSTTSESREVVEELTGQHCELASALEDAPQSVLVGQSVEIACVVSDAPKKPEYIELVPVSHEVAYQRRTHDNEIICCYLGGNNKQKLKLWGEWLCHQHSVGSGFQLRDAERLTAFKHEIKIWGMSLAQIQKLAESNTQKNPPSNFGTAQKRKVEPVAPLPKPLQIDDIEVGDTVRSTTVKHWSYVVLAKQDDGFLDCKRIGADHIRLALHPATIELVSKAIKVEDSEVSQHISIDVNDVPVGVRLERTDDALITEYRVWAWVVVRVFGKPEVQEKSIGTLVESAQGINAHRIHGISTTQPYNRTLDAVKHLVQSAGLKLSDIEAAFVQHEAEIGLASIQPPVLQPQPVATEQKIEADDWVELLSTGDRYQVAEVDNEGIHLVTDDGNMLVQANEIQLLMKIPATWQPFQAPANWQPF